MSSLEAQARKISDAKRTRSELVVVEISKLLATEFPPKKTLLDPWLQSQSLSMLYAWRGVGKTHAALSICYAVASGGAWLKWKAPEPSPVLYLDGEMPAVTLQERLSAIVAATDSEPPPGYLRILTPDLNRDRFMPDLSTHEGQREINAAAESAELIVVDNLSCLARRGGRENEAESWQTVADWGLQQRAAGRSVLFIHHAGKGGAQRGTSKREDILDNVLALRRPGDYEPNEGARFEIHFEKARALFGDEVAAMEAKLSTDEHGRQLWTVRSVEESITEQILQLKADGLSQREIASEIGCGLATVNRHLRAGK